MGTGLLTMVIIAAVWAIRKAGADLRRQVKESRRTREATRREP